MLRRALGRALGGLSPYSPEVGGHTVAQAMVVIFERNQPSAEERAKIEEDASFQRALIKAATDDADDDDDMELPGGPSPVDTAQWDDMNDKHWGQGDASEDGDG